jgi:hypothetical protein
MNIFDAFPSSYLKAADLKGRRVALTIKDVTIEQLGEDKKPVVYFHGTSSERGLVLNKTNASAIAEMYGPETAEWVGRKIIIYSARVEFQGQYRDGIRVDTRPPAEVDAQAPHVRHPEPPPAQPPPATYAAAKTGNGGSHRGVMDDEIPF